MAYAPSDVISRAPGAVFRELSGDQGAVVLNLSSGQYHGVNAVGVVIWELIEPSPTFAALVAGVRSRVSDAPGHLDEDVAGFVEALVERGLATVQTGGAKAG